MQSLRLRANAFGVSKWGAREAVPRGEIAVGDSAPNESIEPSSGLKRQQFPLCRLRLRKDSIPFAQSSLLALGDRETGDGSVSPRGAIIVIIPLWGIVEVAGFRSAPQSQSSHCSLGAVALLVSIDSFASLPASPDSTLC